jgi:imidazolonepropionase-like amidohydrolase
VAELQDLDIKYPVEYVTLLAAVNARLALECGYTAARSGGSLFNIDVWLKKAIENDHLPGPRMAASGREICGVGGLMDWNPDFRKIGMLLSRDVPVIPALQFELASVQRGPEFGLSQRVIDGHQETLDGGAESARMILKAGGRIGMGGDYGFAWNPHGDYAKELTFFVKHVGFTPLETIRCATKTGAEIMGRGKEFGTVEEGKLADLLVVDGDVVADISLLEDRSRFIAVMQGGVIKAGQLA